MTLDRDARHSLRWRLPVLACAVMALVLATFLWAAYVQVEATLVSAAGERAQIAADQVAGLLDGQRSLDQLQQLGADPILRRYLELQDAATREAANTRVNAIAAASGSRRVELWNAAGTRLLEVAERARPGTDKRLPPGSPPFSPGAHELKTVNGLVFWDLIAEIRNEDRPLGLLLIRSMLTESPPGIFSRLVGRDARVRVGNKRGDVWTNFSGLVQGEPVDLERPGVTTYRAANGEMRLGAVSHVRATPLAAWVDFPMAAATTPAAAFLWQMIPIAMVFLAAAAFGLGFLGTRMMRPLSELTVAAEAISTGDYSRRVGETRRDEVGRLARTFNAMAHQVQEAHHRLEGRVVERTARLEAANAELEAFSYSVSHDLRAPLRGIDGFSLAVLEDAGDRLTPTEAGHLRRVRAAAQRMAELIDDLLELGRVGRAELSRGQVDLSATARELAEQFRQAEPDRQMQWEIADGLEAFADARLMRVVLDNLLGNAWKFTANTSAARITVDSEQINGEVVYAVRDNGAGFDMTYADKLFQPFQRLHGEAEFKGTGIGLATVRRIIHRHGGRVWAAGAVGVGATVRFTLPTP